MNKQLILSTALTAVLAAGVSGTALAADKEKCYGVAKAGKNDCAANGHACAGQAKSDNNGKEWKYVAAGTCVEMKGTLKPM
ncbi:DUF2282 domain-containing protein [Chitinibacter sp. FCG-7]|uniref:DUF2282 domain-containing protein n=1 Tax=Chitinibacter mangrovi TaxID=3153927 RepID=A0AAU7F771_9NEIS